MSQFDIKFGYFRKKIHGNSITSVSNILDSVHIRRKDKSSLIIDNKIILLLPIIFFCRGIPFNSYNKFIQTHLCKKIIFNHYFFEKNPQKS